ncbi:MAG: GHMP kinase [Chloroflexi bacterium]|nr:GHMP kinase [Chloroflexota bacterium]
MIISRTPLRVSFVGGGSDLAAYYQCAPGAVVSTAIDKYIYITVNRKFDSRIRASYSVTEIVDSVGMVKHELIREALKLVGVDGGIEITSISDIPSEGTGLGSSSTYTVGLLTALYGYIGRHVGAERLAREACEIEIERCGRPIGKQDQYIAAYGGLQYLRFNPDESVFVNPIICPPALRQTLQSRLMLMYMGTTRASSAILAEQRSNTEHDAGNRRVLGHMVAQADALRAALNQQDLDAFGGILHDGWLAKKQLASGISNGQIDEWYDRARAAGAVGGKVLGAGGGGFLLLYAPPERQAAIERALPELRRIGFGFEPQGSKIIYVED